MARSLAGRRVARNTLSVRKATALIVAATLASVLIGGALITLLDRPEFPDLSTGLWWALQTVTTVGYGDVTPETMAGRLVGAIFMLEALALMTIVTAVITSGFVEHGQQQRLAESESQETVGIALAAQLSEVTAKLEKIQRMLDSAAPAGGNTTR